jgi:hypothetical protein
MALRWVKARRVRRIGEDSCGLRLLGIAAAFGAAT